MRKLVPTIALIALTGAAASAQERPVVNDGAPAPDCRARVNYNVNDTLPGYTDDDGVCQPFTATYQLVPPDYAGDDYYVEEFTDRAISARWERCRQDAACREAAMEGAKGFTKFESRDAGTVDPAGRIDPQGEVALSDIRRPAYFGAERYRESIARAEPRAFTVEFTVPRDTYEREFEGLDDDIKLRGWYITGAGIETSEGGRQRALVIMNNGGGGELTAIDLNGFEGVVFDEESGDYVGDAAAKEVSEEPGMRVWRGFLADLNDAGFDVLITDRRGNGISGGVHGYDTAEQGVDIFRELEQLDSGEGLRVLTPENEELSGADAAAALFPENDVAALPVVLGGYSRGSYAVAWAMQKNVVEDCDYTATPADCGEPRGNGNIKGAILFGPNPGALGYRAAGHDMEEAALRAEFKTAYRLDSGVLANIGKWPAVQIIRGTWDYVEGMEGSLDAYRRASEPKEIFVFHGPHQLATQSPEAMQRVGERMVAFATAAVLERETVEGAVEPEDLRALVLSSPPYWELTTTPVVTADSAR